MDAMQRASSKRDDKTNYFLIEYVQALRDILWYMNNLMFFWQFWL